MPQSIAQALQDLVPSLIISAIWPAPLAPSISMPGMTGLEMLPKAKEMRPDVPIIMITAYGDPETRRKAIEGGAAGLLTKPIDFALLRVEIDSRVRPGLES